MQIITRKLIPQIFFIEEVIELLNLNCNRRVFYRDYIDTGKLKVTRIKGKDRISNLEFVRFAEDPVYSSKDFESNELYIELDVRLFTIEEAAGLLRTSKDRKDFYRELVIKEGLRLTILNLKVRISTLELARFVIEHTIKDRRADGAVNSGLKRK